MKRISVRIHWLCGVSLSRFSDIFVRFYTQPNHFARLFPCLILYSFVPLIGCAHVAVANEFRFYVTRVEPPEHVSLFEFLWLEKGIYFYDEIATSSHL